MIEIELTPTLLSCIQTTAKRAYDQTLREILKGEGKGNDLEEKLEVLRLFLESADFARLRGQYENSLRNGKTVTFKLRLVKGRMEYKQMVGMF
ncbi:MAG: hypothetical protein JW932_20785 [Deltaproteobacteria bacterium]|nr:hypothetical protein [Deltaproteobacteria bacterium]